MEWVVMRGDVWRQVVGDLAAAASSFGESKTQFQVWPSVLGSALVGTGGDMQKDERVKLTW